ncbi:hypothetical protein ASE02_02540 [Phenylobacterium sp. Root700]|nr:hypothetical protein ASE02_02540 [Phenylobacterium sp. Root700]
MWTPVAFGIGAAIYLALPAEPPAAVGFAVLALAGALVAACARWSLGRPLTIALSLTAFALAGFAAGKLRTDSVRAPIAPAGGGVRTIEGFVVDVASPGQGGPRLLLAPIQISGLSPAETPIRVRVTLQDDDTLPAPGTVVSVRGMLNAPPPPPPASPGSYDFARDAFFDGIGGVETSHDCDRWSCAPRAGVATPRVAAIMTRRASTIVRKLPLFCDWAEVVIVRG